jgi:glycerol-3-phosphate responsive antiterminator
MGKNNLVDTKNNHKEIQNTPSYPQRIFYVNPTILKLFKDDIREMLCDVSEAVYGIMANIIIKVIFKFMYSTFFNIMRIILIYTYKSIGEK